MPIHNSAQDSTSGNIALCYVNLSPFHNADEIASLEQQRRNILAICDKHGWIPAWYVESAETDARPVAHPRLAWLKLLERFDDSDVVAVVVNDLFSIYREAEYVLQFVEENDVRLVVANPTLMQLDTSQSLGKMMMTLLDLAYAAGQASK